ncbi:amino acid permease-domain-containing protein [Aspergillus pseudoustus]|uniref:Amino acid permease-domain-containing protein n=1 Tax=Aspergillus pseudoustus TaxID=1810923 RepID=A0ABR4JPA8_9EURO
MTDVQELSDWAPDWLQAITPQNRAGLQVPDQVEDSRLQTPLSQLSQSNHDRDDELKPPKITNITVMPSPNRMVKRKLQGIHLFMITVNGTLGIGLYWRGGQILELAGPLAALLAFLLVGLLSWAVMQCITEMLCIWPIPGALSVYVSEFVDVELGIAVGIAYWFSYSVGFGALIATLAAEFDFWTGTSGDKGIDGGIVYLLIPVILIAVNALDIEIYGLLEVVTGCLKVACLLAIGGVLIAVNVGAGKQGYIGTQYWASPKVYDRDAANDWGTAFLMCLSVAIYAYMGVEIVAASALESAPSARWTRKTSDERESQLAQTPNDSLIGNTVRFSAKYISLLATISYSLSGLLVSFDIPWYHCHLPRLSWVDSTANIDCSDVSDSIPANTTSAIVAIAVESGIPHLADVVNVFLVFTCLSCASTNLYVASRVLFGLTSRLDGGKGQPWHLRLLSWFGRTNRYRVPLRAMIFSAASFIWVPFLQLQGGTSSSTSIGMFIEILAQMSSVAVVIVWTCQVLAFIRYYHCIKRHKNVLEQQKIPQLSRDNVEDYSYRSHAQPVLAYVALAGCLFVLVVANGAYLWKGFHKFPFLSSYLFIVVFVAMWILLKVARGARWRHVDLSNPDKVVRKLRKLHDIRLAAS